MATRGDRARGVRWQQDRSEENIARCPGYEIVPYTRAGVTYEGMARCTTEHPHQRILFWDGEDGPYEKPLYPWLRRLPTTEELLSNAARREGIAQKRGERLQRGHQVVKDFKKASSGVDLDNLPF